MLKYILKLIFHFIFSPYFFLRQLRPIWFFLLNGRNIASYKNQHSELDKVQRRIAEELKQNGIAVTHLNELFPRDVLLDVFHGYTHKLRSTAEVRTSKKFLEYLWDDVPILDFENPFLNFSLNPKILEIVNSYMEMYVRFYYFTLNITTVVKDGFLPVQSQRWHRDPEDKKMCKIFIYLTDVDDNSGPFMYIPKSHYGGKWDSLFTQRSPFGIYPPLGSVERVVKAKEIKVCKGKAGTVIFCDTIGLHKGGYATLKERIMFTAGYVSPSSPWPIRYKLPDDFESRFSQLSLSARHTLTLKPPKFSSYLLKRYRKLLALGF